MYIYIIQENNKKSGYIKIGKASNVEERLRTLQTANPRKLTLIGKIKAKSEAHAFSVENEIHRKLKKYNERGEWFRNEKGLRKIISEYDVYLCKMNNRLFGMWNFVATVPAYITAPSKTKKKSKRIKGNLP